MNDKQYKFWAIPGYIGIKKPWAQDKMKITDGQTGKIIYDAEKELAKRKILKSNIQDS